MNIQIAKRIRLLGIIAELASRWTGQGLGQISNKSTHIAVVHRGKPRGKPRGHYTDDQLEWGQQVIRKAASNVRKGRLSVPGRPGISVVATHWSVRIERTDTVNDAQKPKKTNSSLWLVPINQRAALHLESLLMHSESMISIAVWRSAPKMISVKSFHQPFRSSSGWWENKRRSNKPQVGLVWISWKFV